MLKRIEMWGDMRSGIVLGAAGDIGSAIAKSRAKVGDTLLLVDYHTKELVDIEHDVVTVSKGSVQSRSINIAESNALGAVFNEFCADEHLDYLINCVGVWFDGTSEIDDERLDLMLNINLRAAIVAAKTAAKYMIRGSHIVTLASQSGIRARRGLGGYAASKFGVVGYNEALHKELAIRGIKSTAICPGMVDSRMTSEDHNICPPDRMIRPVDVARAVTFLFDLSAAATIDRLTIECKGQTLHKG